MLPSHYSPRVRAVSMNPELVRYVKGAGYPAGVAWSWTAKQPQSADTPPTEDDMMEYQYSTVLPPAEYETVGLCVGMPVRRHKDWIKEDIGSLRAQDDWNRLVSTTKGFHGGLASPYSFMQLTIPECLPERLEIISYANEFAFLHDDMTDNASQEEGDHENDQVLAAFLEVVKTGSVKASVSGKQKLQLQMFQEMLRIDRDRAVTTIKSWAAFLQVASGREHHTAFKTLDEYIPYRILDVGEMFWFGVVTFGMAITIPDHEMELCRKLTRGANILFGLTNDLYSWEKECLESERSGRSHVVNAIWVIMQEHSISAAEAKEVCIGIIKDTVKDYLGVIESCRDDPNLSLDLRRYVEAMQYSHSGNCVWSRYCPRYQVGAAAQVIARPRL